MKIHSKEEKTDDTYVSKPKINNSERVYELIEPCFSFEDMILNKSTYDQIQDALAFLEYRKLIFVEWGLEKTHKLQNKSAINFFGESGTGKTMAAHAVAKQLNRQLLIVDYSQIESKYVGETSKNITALFSYAKEMNAIILFDEADALLSKRVRNMEHSTDTSVNQTRSHLLMKLNDYDDVIIFATNFIENYDPAFMRRIATHVKFEMPDYEGRNRLWKLFVPNKMPNTANFEQLSMNYDRVSGADIQNAVMTAALRAAREHLNVVPNEYFAQAIMRIREAKLANLEEYTTANI